MTLEERIERLEKIILVLEPCIPQSKYAREHGLKPDDVIEARQLLKEIKVSYNRRRVVCKRVREEDKQ